MFRVVPHARDEDKDEKDREVVSNKWQAERSGASRSRLIRFYMTLTHSFPIYPEIRMASSQQAVVAAAGTPRAKRSQKREKKGAPLGESEPPHGRASPPARRRSWATDGRKYYMSCRRGQGHRQGRRMNSYRYVVHVVASKGRDELLSQQMVKMCLRLILIPQWMPLSPPDDKPLDFCSQ